MKSIKNISGIIFSVSILGNWNKNWNENFQNWNENWNKTFKKTETKTFKNIQPRNFVFPRSQCLWNHSETGRNLVQIRISEDENESLFNH